MHAWRADSMPQYAALLVDRNSRRVAEAGLVWCNVGAQNHLQTT